MLRQGTREGTREGTRAKVTLAKDTNTSDLSRICFDCFTVTRSDAIRQILSSDRFETGHVLLQCSELCRRAAQILTLQGSVSPNFVRQCAEACAACADYCEARDMDACAILCWEAAAALGDEWARLASPMMLAAE